MLKDIADFVKPGMTERQIEAVVQYAYAKASFDCQVILIGSDERIAKYRHPIASDKAVEKTLLIHPAASYFQPTTPGPRKNTPMKIIPTTSPIYIYPLKNEGTVAGSLREIDRISNEFTFNQYCKLVLNLLFSLQELAHVWIGKCENTVPYRFYNATRYKPFTIS